MVDLGGVGGGRGRVGRRRVVLEEAGGVRLCQTARHAGGVAARPGGGIKNALVNTSKTTSEKINLFKYFSNS